MRRAWALLRALSTDWLRNREAVFFAFLFPVILLLIFGSVFGGGTGEFGLHVQNNDVGPDGQPTNLSATFVDALSETGALSVSQVDPGRDVAAWSEETGATRVLVVPEGFAAQVRAASADARRAVIVDTLARAGTVNDSTRAAVRDQLPANATDADPAVVRFLAASDDEAAPAIRGVVGSVVARFNERAVGVDTPPARVESGALGGQNLDGADYYLPALLAAVVMINGLITLTTVVAEFTADGTLKRLVATPLRRRDWILATVVQQSVLTLLVTALMVAVAHLVFGVSVVPGPLAIGLLLLGTVGFAGFGMALGSLVDGPEAATSLGMAVALPMMFVSGVFWELDLMPGFLQTLATVLPLYHFHRGLRRLMVLGTTEGVLVPFVVLGVVAVAGLVAALATTTWRDF